MADQGFFATASFTPAAAAYSANDVIGVAQKFTLDAGKRDVRTGGLIRVKSANLRIAISALQASEGAYNLYLYSRTPPSALADNAAFDLTAADLPYYRGVIAFTTPVDAGSSLFVKVSGLDLDVNLEDDKNYLYGYLQTVAGFTMTAVARQITLEGELY